MLFAYVMRTRAHILNWATKYAACMPVAKLPPKIFTQTAVYVDVNA